MRVLALIAAHNEERFIGACLEHLHRHGIATYLTDNESSDATVEIAERFRGRGLVGIETLPRPGFFRWRTILERKEQLAATLDADWFMHVDADEFLLPPSGTMTLAAALARVDGEGDNAVNFTEFTFVPTREAPDHDHRDFQRTMCWYYPFAPSPVHRLIAWKRQGSPVELAWSGGHEIRFPGRRPHPQSFPMRHYLFLSVSHAVWKYIERGYDPDEVRAGWHRARAALRREDIRLPREAELRRYVSDAELDASTPRTRHFLFDPEWLERQWGS